MAPLLAPLPYEEEATPRQYFPSPERVQEGRGRICTVAASSRLSLEERDYLCLTRTNTHMAQVILVSLSLVSLCVSLSLSSPSLPPCPCVTLSPSLAFLS